MDTLELQDDALTELENSLSTLVDMTNQTEEAEALTQAVALESVGLLGHDGLLKAYYGPGSRVQKYQLATEGFADAIKTTLTKVYDKIREIIRKIIDWIKGLFGFKSKDQQEIESILRSTKGVFPTLQALLAKSATMSNPTQLRELLEGTELRSQYIHAMTLPAYDLLTDGPLTKASEIFIQQLRHSKVVDDATQTFTDLQAWYHRHLLPSSAPRSLAQATRELTELMAAHQTEFEKMREAHATYRDVLVRQHKPQQSDTRWQIAYDFRALFMGCGHAQGKYEMSQRDNLTAVRKFAGSLQALDQMVDVQLKRASDLGKSGASKEMKQASIEYFKALTVLSQRLVIISRMVAIFDEYAMAFIKLTTKTLIYTQNVASKVHQKTGDSATHEIHQIAKDTSTKLRPLSAGLSSGV